MPTSSCSNSGPERRITGRPSFCSRFVPAMGWMPFYSCGILVFHTHIVELSVERECVDGKSYDLHQRRRTDPSSTRSCSDANVHSLSSFTFPQRRFDGGRVPSATCPRGKFLPIRPRPDFPLYSKVMREELFTGSGARRAPCVPYGPIFSGPVACAELVK